MYDCSYNHYLVQQHLYAFFLSRKYDINVESMLLVQCHPNLSDYNVATLKQDKELAAKVFEAFNAGWRNLLPQICSAC